MQNPITSSSSTAPVYKTLDDIRLRKEAVVEEIRKDDELIRSKWQSLFHKPDMLNAKATPSRRFNSLLATGAGMVDAAIFGWKLYRKFKK